MNPDNAATSEPAPPMHDNDSDRFPEMSAKQRCAQYGHIVRAVDLLGPACLRCGLFDPAWREQGDGTWRA